MDLREDHPLLAKPGKHDSIVKRVKSAGEIRSTARYILFLFSISFFSCFSCFFFYIMFSSVLYIFFFFISQERLFVFYHTIPYHSHHIQHATQHVTTLHTHTHLRTPHAQHARNCAARTPSQLICATLNNAQHTHV